MAPPAIAPGSLAFVGPAQVPSLDEFRYVRVLAVEESSARVALVSIEEEDDETELEDPVDAAILRKRRVSEAEGGLWPGMFVGHPIAFVWSDGERMDEWAFGVVTGYRMCESMAWFNVRTGDITTRIRLEQPPNVVKVDWVNYILQTGAGSNVAITNAEELVDLMNEVSALCAKCRTSLPAKVLKLLTVPFEGAAFAPVIRPDTLAVTNVPRQHVLSCALNKKGKKGASMFEVPADAGAPQRHAKRKNSQDDSHRAPRKRSKEAALVTTSTASNEPDLDTVPPHDEEDDGSDAEDIRAVLHQSRSFTSDHARTLGVNGDAPLASLATPAAGPPIFALDDARGRSATTFKPTTLELQIHKTIGHPGHEGKDPQCILECAQQARETRFRGSPPVLRGAYDFGFYVRGLSVMHFVKVSRASLSDPVVNMTDFSRKNALPAVAAEPSYRGLVNALSNLHRFGRIFYNKATVKVLKAAVDFMEEFADAGEPDQATTKCLTLWINMKLGKFRGLLISDGLRKAIRVKAEFTLQDPLLGQLLHDLHRDKVEDLKTFVEARQTPTGQVGRQTWSNKPGAKVPQNVSRTLPKQGSLQLCLRYLSNSGCNERQPGKCYSRVRAHFRPPTLSQEAKDHITKHFGGLAPEFADL